MGKKLESSRSKRLQLTIVPAPGGWTVKGMRTSRKSKTYSTQREAESAARVLLNAKRGGEVVVHGRDGRIKSVDTYVLGDAAARTLSAVEGISVSEEVDRDFRDLDRRNLTPKQRRAWLAAKYAKS